MAAKQLFVDMGSAEALEAEAAGQAANTLADWLLALDQVRAAHVAWLDAMRKTAEAKALASAGTAEIAGTMQQWADEMAAVAANVQPAPAVPVLLALTAGSTAKAVETRHADKEARDIEEQKAADLADKKEQRRKTKCAQQNARNRDTRILVLREFPVGCRVAVNNGRKRYYEGTVAWLVGTAYPPEIVHAMREEPGWINFTVGPDGFPRNGVIVLSGGVYQAPSITWLTRLAG